MVGTKFESWNFFVPKYFDKHSGVHSYFVYCGLLCASLFFYDRHEKDGFDNCFEYTGTQLTCTQYIVTSLSIFILKPSFIVMFAGVGIVKSCLLAHAYRVGSMGTRFDILILREIVGRYDFRFLTLF